MINRLFTKKEHQDVNEALDAEWALRLYGPSHRSHFGHDPISVYMLYGNDPDKIQGAASHIATDFATTAYKKELRKTLGHEKYGRWKEMQELVNKPDRTKSETERMLALAQKVLH